MSTPTTGTAVLPNTRTRFQSLGVDHQVRDHGPGAVIFAQGADCGEVMYLVQGSVKLCVRSGKGQAILSVLHSGDFFGEGCLADQPLYLATAVALTVSTVAVIEKQHMIEMLGTRPTLREQFLLYILKRNIRIEEDLIDHLFNSVEKRLARTLVLLAGYGTENGFPEQGVPKLSQAALAEIVGTTRSHVNRFMKKFEKLGFIEYNGGIKVKPALLSVVLHP